MVSVADARLSAARAAIAHACLDVLPDARLGEITLRAEQRRIVARAERVLRLHGGCLVAEDVGRGKTFIALALARRWRCPMIVAPASLRATWLDAQSRAGVAYAFASHESLSRGVAARVEFDALVVDESHHFRNPATARYGELARMAASVPIVLLSATPLQNRARDLAAQLALFHGEAALMLPVERLASLIIRGDDAPTGDMPTVAIPEWIPVAADDGAVLSALLDLPPPPRPVDGGDAGALRTIALVRAWASSRAALRSMLRSRRRMTTAIAQGVEVGRMPTRREARDWQAAEDVVQLGFAPVLMRASAHAHALLDVRVELDADDAAQERLRSALERSSDPDVERVTALLALRRAHAGSRIIAFSEYASTVTAYFNAMRGHAGVGMLTARGGSIVTGRIPRDELLARFAPRAQRATPYAPHDEITLLLATDLLSEGVNLQDASVVVHLDLPWNPARMAQRVGRVRRPGGAAIVRSFLIAPPAGTDALLVADARLRRKLEWARGAIGVGFDVLPLLAHPTAGVPTRSATPSSASAGGAFVAHMERWALEHQSHREPASGGVVGTATHAERGWIAALSDGRVLANIDGRTTDTPHRLDTLARSADGCGREPRGAEVELALADVNAWVRDEHLLAIAGVAGDVGPVRTAIHKRLSVVAVQSRRHDQARIFALLSRVRTHLAAPMPLGAEQALLQSVTRGASGAAHAIGELTSALEPLDSAALTRRISAEPLETPRVVAIVVVGPAAAVT